MASAGFWGGLLGGLSQSLQASQQLSLEKQELALRRKQLDKNQRTEDVKFAANIALAVPQFAELLRTAENTGDTESANRIRKSLESVMQLSQQMLDQASADTSGLPGGFKADKSLPRPSTKPMTLSTGPGAAKPESSPTAGSEPSVTPSDQAETPSGPTTPLPNRKLLRPDLTEQIAKGSGAAKITRDETGRVTELMFETPEQREAFQQNLEGQEQTLKAKSGITLRDQLTEGVSQGKLDNLRTFNIYDQYLSQIGNDLPRGFGVVPVNDGMSTKLRLAGQREQKKVVDGEETDETEIVNTPFAIDALREPDGKLNPTKLSQALGVLSSAKDKMPPELQPQFEKLISEDVKRLGLDALTLLEAEGVVKRKEDGGYDLNPFDISDVGGDYGPRRADYVGAFNSLSKVLGSDLKGISATALQDAPVRLMEALDKTRERNESVPELAGPTARSLMSQVIDLTKSYAHSDTGTVKPGTESTAVTNMLMFMADSADSMGLENYLEGAKRTLLFLPDEDRQVAAERINQKLNMIGVWDGDLTELLLSPQSMRRTLLGPSKVPAKEKAPQSPQDSMPQAPKRKTFRRNEEEERRKRTLLGHGSE